MPDMVRRDDELLLDLLNSAPVVDGKQTDELRGAGATDWLRAHDIPGTPKQARDLRDAIAAVVRGEAAAGSLQPYLAGVSQVPSIDGQRVHWRLKGSRFTARAVFAWSELQGRLRACENDECRLFLIDRSRANARRWCSMAACGNRLKARRHHQRQSENAGRRHRSSH
jgi:CGNR zinc finger/Putative stress-induced transcription regulator